VVERKDSALWNEFIDRYHYLGYTPLSGAQLRCGACGASFVVHLPPAAGQETYDQRIGVGVIIRKMVAEKGSS